MRAKNTNTKLNKKYYYVAYGSNMLNDQMSYRCNEAKYINTGFILDYKLIFDDVATIEKSKKSKTPAVLYEITGRDKMILDNFEGEPFCYKWTKITFITMDGQLMDCYTYIKRATFKQLPNTDYIAKIIQGYYDYNLPIKYLFKAIQETYLQDFYTDEYILYGAYGSNLNMADMLDYRCVKSIPFGTGKLNDYELFYNGVASIRPKKGSKCPIGLWLIHWSDMDALDGYEGFPNFYGKKYFNVSLNSDFKTPCMIYVMNNADGNYAPSTHYYNTIKQGYKDFGMDLSYLEKSIEIFQGVSK